MNRAWIIGMVLAVLAAWPVAAQPTETAAELARRAAAAGADPQLVASVRTRALEQGLPDVQTARLLRPAVVLAEADLPSRHVLQKALEGLAKRIPAPRVSVVLADMERHTAHAGRLIGPWLQRPEVGRLLGNDGPGASRADSRRYVLVENLAQALQQQVPEETVTAVLETLPQAARRREIPAAEVGAALGILGDLPTAANDPGTTARLVASALDAGFSPSEMRRLPAAIRAAEQRAHVPPGVVARDAADRMQGGARAAEVLSDLFRGQPAGAPPPHAGPADRVGPEERGQGGGRGQGKGPGGNGQGNRPPGNGPPGGGSGGGPGGGGQGNGPGGNGPGGNGPGGNGQGGGPPRTS